MYEKHGFRGWGIWIPIVFVVGGTTAYLSFPQHRELMNMVLYTSYAFALVWLGFTAVPFLFLRIFRPSLFRKVEEGEAEEEGECSGRRISSGSG